MKKFAIIALLLAGSLLADQSGIWKGTGGIVDSKYGTVPTNAQLTLLQAGSKLQGTFQVGNGTPMAITNGSVSGTTVVFSVGPATATFTATGNQMVGKMTSTTGKIVNFVFTKQP
jgi:hypothetical protein